MRVAHVGGKRLNKSDAGYRVLLDWIAGGARTDDDDAAACAKIVVYPGPVARAALPPRRRSNSACSRTSATAPVRDVTALATYDVSHKDVVGVDARGLVTGLKRGQAAVSVRYLHHLESVTSPSCEDVDGFAWTDPPENNFIDRLVHAKLKQLAVLPVGHVRRRRPSSAASTSTSPACCRPAEQASAFLADAAAGQAGEADRRAARARGVRPVLGAADGRPDARQPEDAAGRPGRAVRGLDRRRLPQQHAVRPVRHRTPHRDRRRPQGRRRRTTSSPSPTSKTWPRRPPNCSWGRGSTARSATTTRSRTGRRRTTTASRRCSPG